MYLLPFTFSREFHFRAVRERLRPGRERAVFERNVQRQQLVDKCVEQVRSGVEQQGVRGSAHWRAAAPCCVPVARR